MSDGMSSAMSGTTRDGCRLMGTGPMLNAYPDSLEGSLDGLVRFLDRPELDGVFGSCYILPSVFHSDLDRGFSVIDYGINRMVATEKDMDELRRRDIRLMFDFVLNHASVLSAQFQDIVKNGAASRYRDFFIDWNEFWKDHGTMTPEGYIQPDPEKIRGMFFRKPGLPILFVRFPGGREVPYWNTFYQEVRYAAPGTRELMTALGLQYGEADALGGTITAGLAAGKRPSEIDYGRFAGMRDAIVNELESRREYFGQMDLNIRSPLVWEFYEDTLGRLAGYGAALVRLDAFAYAPKEPGARNFLNDPGTWDLLERVSWMAERKGLEILPEIHASYGEKIHETVSAKGYLTYDFFLPGLIIDAFERKTNEALFRWIRDIVSKGIRTVNMLGCHDGIPLLDLKGLLPEAQIQNLIDVVVSRGGYVKNLHGQTNVYYQVNATYYSALGESDERMLLARAIQIFMPGKPQVWYLDLFAGRNDHEAVERAGPGGHKEINRTNLDRARIEEELGRLVVTKQLELLRFRNRCRAFGFDARLEILPSPSDAIKLKWTNGNCEATLDANLANETFSITARDETGATTKIC
jgi:sucrose phosphorylase